MKHRLFQIAFFFIAASVAGFAQTAKPNLDAKGISSDIANIASGAGSSERGAAIKTELAELKVRVSTEGFTRDGKTAKEISGTNIIAEVPNPNAKRTLMIGAHYDRVPVGNGAVDNASGSAAVLFLLRAFKERPMKTVRLQAAFWDAEEKGLVGSKFYVEARKEKGLPNIYINFDIFGYGDTLWLWSTAPELEFAKSFIAIAERSADSFKVSSLYPPSDHRTFAVPGVESYSFSLVPAAEVDAILKLFGGEQVEPAKMPKVLQTIHTPNDTIDKIDADAVAKALKVVESAIRALDK
jgi:Zn-dependent M28 family amino/carboxypeptidase